MLITYRCPECSETYDLDADLAGKTIRCRECDQPGRVPGTSRKPQPKLSLAPVVRKEQPSNTRNILLLKSSIPIWGTFLILLAFFLVVLGWGGWSAYEKYVLVPKRIQTEKDMRELWMAWNHAMRQAAYARSLLGVNGEEAERNIEVLESFHKSMPEEWRRQDDEDRHQQSIRSFRQNGQSEDAWWRAKYQECARRAEVLDQESCRRFGVHAVELP